MEMLAGSEVILVIAAFLTSSLSGMTGLGGGTILVALLFTLLAPATALPLHAVVQLTSNATRTIAYARHVNKRALIIFLLTAIPAPFLVAPFIAQVDASAVKLILGIFLLVMFKPVWLQKIGIRGGPGFAVAGIFAGGLGTVVGATGAITAPFFLHPGWRKEMTVGTKAVCQACAHLVKLAAFSSVGLGVVGDPLLVVSMCLAVVIGTFTGKKMLGFLDESKFQIIYRGLVLILGVRLIVMAVIDITS